MNFDSVYSEYCSNGGRLGEKMYAFLQTVLNEFRYTPSNFKAPTKEDLLQNVVVTLMKNDHQKLRHIMASASAGNHQGCAVRPEEALSRQLKTIINHCLYDDKQTEKDALHNLSERIIFALKQDPYYFKDVRASSRSWLVSPQAVGDGFPSEPEIEASFRKIVPDCSCIPKLLFNSTRASPIYKGPEFDLLCKTLAGSIPAFVKSDIYQFLRVLLPDWGSGSVKEEDRKNETTEGLDDMALQIATSAVDRLDARSKAVVSAYFSMENPNWVQVAMATEGTKHPVDRKDSKQIVVSFGESLLEIANDYPFAAEEILERAVKFLPDLLFRENQS
jgi:hypothetical protein